MEWDTALMVIGVFLFVIILWGFRREGELSIWESLLLSQERQDALHDQRQARKREKMSMTEGNGVTMLRRLEHERRDSLDNLERRR